MLEVRGDTWSLLAYQPQHQRKDETIYAARKVRLRSNTCACRFASQIHTIHHKISSPLHRSYALHILSKSVVDLRLEPCPGSHSELRVSHYRHISTLYFANARLLIKGQRASKKKMFLSTYSDQTSAEHWKITRAFLTGPMLCGGVVKAAHFDRPSPKSPDSRGLAFR